MAEATDTPTPEKKKAEPRPYFVFAGTTTVAVDLSTQEGIAALAAAAGDRAQFEVLIVHGETEGLDPKKALKSYGADVDLEGDFSVVAKNSFNEFKGVSSGTKRVVNI